jgi:F-type H+-transporting ATPase subunit a
LYQGKGLIMNLSLFDYHTVQPFAWLGLTGDFWSLNIETLIHTWIAMALLFCFVLFGRKAIKKEFSLAATVYEKFVLLFVNMSEEAFSAFNYRYFAFIASIFTFTFAACLVGLIPFLDEATKDLNTTFALAMTSFIYVQYQKIKVHHLSGFLREFATPSIVMAPMHIIGDLAKIASMTFRLFGNILGGGVILIMMIEFVGIHKFYFMSFTLIALPIIVLIKLFNLDQQYSVFRVVSGLALHVILALSWLQMGFGIFEGMIQSYVLTMLTATYLAIGIQHEDDDHVAEDQQAPKEHA